MKPEAGKWRRLCAGTISIAILLLAVAEPSFAGQTTIRIQRNIQRATDNWTITFSIISDMTQCDRYVLYYDKDQTDSQEIIPDYMGAYDGNYYTTATITKVFNRAKLEERPITFYNMKLDMYSGGTKVHTVSYALQKYPDNQIQVPKSPTSSPDDFYYHSYSNIQSRMRELFEGQERARLDEFSQGSKGQRQIRFIKIALNPATNDPAKKDFVFISGQQACEWMGIEVNLNLAKYFNENYSIDPKVHKILNHGELWFVPVANPDALFYIHDENYDWHGKVDNYSTERNPAGTTLTYDDGRAWYHNRNFASNMGGIELNGSWLRVPLEPEVNAIQEFKSGGIISPASDLVGFWDLHDGHTTYDVGYPLLDDNASIASEVIGTLNDINTNYPEYYPLPINALTDYIGNSAVWFQANFPTSRAFFAELGYEDYPVLLPESKIEPTFNQFVEGIKRFALLRINAQATPATNFSATAGDQAVTLQWVPPVTYSDGIALTPDFILGYRLWRLREGSSSCSSRRKSFGSQEFCLAADESIIGASSTSYVDGGLTNGENYHYILETIDRAEEAGLSTAPVTARPVDATVPGNPMDLKSRGGNGRARLTWMAPTKNADGSDLTDLAGYWIYYAIGSNSSSRVWVAAPATSYELTALTNDKPYFVWLTAEDEVGNESEPSATVTVKPLNALWVHESGGPSGSGTSISDSLADAYSGSIKTVMVGPGTYSEPQLTIGPGYAGDYPTDITLMSERGPAQTAIEGQSGSEFVVTVGDYSRLIGFTIRHPGERRGIQSWFNEGVLIANNIFVANSLGIYFSGVYGSGGADATNIYNNVFHGNQTGIFGYFSFNSYGPRIINNIFQGNRSAGIKIDYFDGFSIHHNDFSDTGKAIWDVTGNREKYVYGNMYFSPGFVDISSEPHDFHLKPSSSARDAGAHFAYIDPVTQRNQVWEECDPTKPGVDLGAFGGPFAYVDNNGNSIPDCDELHGVPIAVAMMRDTVDYPIVLSARTPLSDAAAAPAALAVLSDAGTLSDLIFTVVSGPDHGTLSGAPPEVAYTPAPGYAGEDAFSFTVSGEIGVSEPARVSITVKATNAPPVAVDQTIRLAPNSSVTLALQGNDADGDALTFAVDSSPAFGYLECLMSPEYGFQPEYGFTGEVSFTFHVNDGIADSAAGTVRFLVGGEPGIAVTAPAGAQPATNASSFTIAWSETDPNGAGTISLYRDGDALGLDGELIVADLPASDPANAYAWDISGLGDGTYYVHAAIRDAGGTGLAYAPGPLVIDRTGPAVTAEPPGGLCRAAQSVTLSANEIATIYYTTDGSEPTTASAMYVAPIAVGIDTTIRFLGVDGLGNVGEVTAASYAIDTVPPAVTIDPFPALWRSASITVTGTMEAGATASLAVDTAAAIAPVTYPTTSTWSADVTGLVEGTNTFTATATDSAGNPAGAMAGLEVNLNQPPVLDPIGDKSASENQTLSFTVTAGDPDGTTPVITASSLPEGATFDGSVFSWTPAYEQSGTYTVTFTASDGDVSDAEAIAITIVDVNRAPTVPVLLAPRTQTEVETPQPELAVENSVDPDADPLVYEYEIYADAGMQQLLLDSPSVPEGDAITSWTASANLPDNAWHWWRARACDGRGGCSDWTEAASFFVNTANDPPAPFFVSAPQHGADVAALAPELAVTNSSDLDGDALSYSFLVCSDEGLTQHAASVAGLPAGAGGTTTWVIDPPLSDNTWYYWKAVVSDAHGTSTETVAAAFFVNLANEPPGTPQPSSPAEGEELAALAADLTVFNAVDPEADPVSYLFELDTLETFDGPAWRSSGWLFAGMGTTTWALADLADNTLYHWRVKASDGLVASDWARRAFFTNTANDAPSAVTPLNPGAESWVDSVTPRLEVSSATDADRDAIAYAYEIYGDPPLMPLAQAQTPEAFWVCSETLPDNAWYTWRAAAIDEHGLAGPWSALSRFFVNNNGIDDPPSITVTEPAADYALAGGSFVIRWVDADPDSNAAVSLSYDTDSAGEDGTPIADALAEDPDGGDNDAYAWDVSALPPGRYWVYATITDGPTTRTSYGLGSVTIGSPPVASAGPDRVGTVGQALSFSAAASSDPDGVIVGYSWNWGDGTADGAGVSATHSYAVAGAYTVTLTVTDNLGAAGTDTAAVVINAPVSLALNKPARASSTQSGSFHTAAKAVDGSTTTSWMSDKSNKAQWVQVDLGSSTSISKVRVVWPAIYFARAFRIETSSNGTFWTTRYSTSSGNGSVTNADLAPVSARFVRVYCTSPNGSRYYGVSELEVYQ